MAQTPPAIGGRVSRRDFLKLMAAAGTVMTFTPFVDWGKFLPNPVSSEGERAKAELADGTVANVNTFQVNHSEVIIYPKSDDRCAEPGSVSHMAVNKASTGTWRRQK